MREVMGKEIKTMLEWGLFIPGKSEWTSPCILVPKPDGTHRFCIDYRKVNAVIRKDNFPLPRIEDCIEAVGEAKYVSKIDLLKGYWQIGLTPIAI